MVGIKIETGKINELKERAWDLIYPRDIYCICCGNIIDQTRTYGLCDHCITHMGWNGDGVQDIPSENSKNDLKVLNAVDYGIYARSIIFAFKYDGHTYIARNVAEIMADKLRDVGFTGEEILVPVPLHPQKERVRGFNQSRLIAEYLGKECRLFTVDCLERIRETKSMRGLGAFDRAANIEGSMAVKKEFREKLEGKSVILIDDFFTTGSTAGECKRVLEAEGVRDVTLFAFAARRRWQI